MNPQLQAVVDSFQSAQQRVERLEQRLSEQEWARRPEPGRWSPLECLVHLNLTAEAFLPRLRDGLERARLARRPGPARYRRDLWGWMIWRALEEPGRFKTTTAAAFVPGTDRPAAEVLAEFRRLQEAQMTAVRDADGLPIDRVRIASPFNERLKYSVYSALTILPVHQHRHLWQAGG